MKIDLHTLQQQAKRPIASPRKKVQPRNNVPFKTILEQELAKYAARRESTKE